MGDGRHSRGSQHDPRESVVDPPHQHAKAENAQDNPETVKRCINESIGAVLATAYQKNGQVTEVVKMLRHRMRQQKKPAEN